MEPIITIAIGEGLVLLEEKPEAWLTSTHRALATQFGHYMGL